MYRNPEVKLEIAPGMDMDEIHMLFASALEFPAYYGRNWDAFEECINDDEASNPPIELIVLGWDTFIEEHLSDARHFWACINSGLERRKKPTTVFVSPRSCPCCGHLTLSDWHSGSYEVCGVCNWEDDGVQSADPLYRGGANIESLDEARARFRANSLTSSIPKDFR